LVRIPAGVLGVRNVYSAVQLFVTYVMCKKINDKYLFFNKTN
jgi:hypothetical protein